MSRPANFAGSSLFEDQTCLGDLVSVSGSVDRAKFAFDKSGVGIFRRLIAVIAG